MLTTSKMWTSRIYSARNVFRKEEHDWKMVYLARTEESQKAVIEWKVDVSARKLSIKDIAFRADTKIYEDAKITWEFVTKTGAWICIRFPGLFI